MSEHGLSAQETGSTKDANKAADIAATGAATSTDRPEPAGPADRTGLPFYALPLLLLLSLALYLPGFFDLPPFDRDESRFAQASYQMLESGDLVDIRYQDEARHKKPIGIYWLQSASSWMVAPLIDGAKQIWTYRLPSLIGAILSVLAAAVVAARLFGGKAGLLTGVMLASCVVLGVEARLAKTDAVLLATIVIAQGALAHLYLSRDQQQTGRAAALIFWIACGVGVLIKGPITLMVGLGTLATLGLWDRKVGWMKRLRPLAGIGIVALIAAPWLIAITIKTGGAFFTESIGHDMLGKVAGGQESKGLPPGYYLGTFWITFAPWSFLVLLALPWIWRHRKDPAVRFCVAWIIPIWIIFEAVPTKLLHYTMTVFPAIAALTAAAALDRFGIPAGVATGPSRRRKILTWTAIILGAVGFAALTIAVAAMPTIIDHSIQPVGLLMVPLVLGLFFISIQMFRRGRVTPATLAGTASALILYAVAYQLVLPGIIGLWISRSAANALAEVRDPSCTSLSVAATGYHEPSLVFLVGTDTRLTNAEGAAELLRDAADPTCTVALVESRQEAAFQSALAGLPVERKGAVVGLNYNNGRPTTLTLYAPVLYAPGDKP